MPARSGTLPSVDVVEVRCSRRPVWCCMHEQAESICSGRAAARYSLPRKPCKYLYWQAASRCCCWCCWCSQTENRSFLHLGRALAHFPRACSVALAFLHAHWHSQRASCARPNLEQTNTHSLTLASPSLPLSLSASSRRASSRRTTTTHSTGGHRDDVEADARATTTTTTPSQTGRDDEATTTYLRTNFTALIRPRIAARLGPLRDAQALGPPS